MSRTVIQHVVERLHDIGITHFRSARLGLRPIVFVLNNNGYLIERLLCKEPSISYNDIAQWRYTSLPAAFGCDYWLVRWVTKNAELDAEHSLRLLPSRSRRAKTSRLST